MSDLAPDEQLAAENAVLCAENARLRTENAVLRAEHEEWERMVAALTQRVAEVERMLTYRWALRTHRNKPKRWIVNHYYGQFNPARQDNWVFGDRTSGAFQVRFGWTGIVRHPLVKGAASPDGLGALPGQGW